MAEQSVIAPSNNTANLSSHVATQPRSRSTHASNSAERTATSTSLPAPITPPNPITPDSPLFQRIVEILSTTANGCIFELGYPQLCEKLASLEQDYAKLREAESQLRAECQKLAIALTDEKKVVNILKEENSRLRGENLSLRSNPSVVINRELEAKYRYVLEVLNERQGQNSPGPGARIVPSHSHPSNPAALQSVPRPDANVLHSQSHLHPQQHPYTQYPQHPLQQPAPNTSHSEYVIPAKRPLSGSDHTAPSSTASSSASSSRKATRSRPVRPALSTSTSVPGSIQSVNQNMISPMNAMNPVLFSSTPNLVHSRSEAPASIPVYAGTRPIENGTRGDIPGVVPGFTPMNPRVSFNDIPHPIQQPGTRTANANMRAPAVEPRWVGPQPQRPDQYPAPSPDVIARLEAAERATKALDQRRPRTAGATPAQPIASGSGLGRRAPETSNSSLNQGRSNVGLGDTTGHGTNPAYPVSIDGGNQFDISMFEQSIRNALEARRRPPIATGQQEQHHDLSTTGYDASNQVVPTQGTQSQSPLQTTQPSVPPPPQASIDAPQNEAAVIHKQLTPPNATEGTKSAPLPAVTTSAPSAGEGSSGQSIVPTPADTHSIQSQSLVTPTEISSAAPAEEATPVQSPMEVDEVIAAPVEAKPDSVRVTIPEQPSDEIEGQVEPDNLTEQRPKPTEMSPPLADTPPVQHADRNTNMMSEAIEQNQNISNVTDEHKEDEEEAEEETEEDWSDLTDDEERSESGKRPVVDCISSIFYDDEEDERYCQLCNLRIRALNLADETPPTFSDSGMRDLIMHAKNEHPVAWGKLRKCSDDTPS